MIFPFRVKYGVHRKKHYFLHIHLCTYNLKYSLSVQCTIIVFKKLNYQVSSCEKTQEILFLILQIFQNYLNKVNTIMKQVDESE